MERDETERGRRLDLSGLLQKKNLIFWIGLAGICLIFLSDMLFGAKPQESGAAVPAQEAPQETGAAGAEQALETRLAQLLTQVEGAGRVCVMVTLENTGETVYAYDERTETQTDASGADQTPRRTQSYQNEHILYDAAQGKQPLVETCMEPEVKGVAVICEGGDDISVIKRITELVSVVLRLPTNRVCVTKMIETGDAS